MSKSNNRWMKRRDFLKYTGISMAAAALPKGVASLPLFQEKEKTEELPIVEPRKRIPNPYMKNGKPMVVVVEGENIEAMIMKAFEALGGLGKIAKGSSDALLKPNFVFPAIYPEITAGESIKTVFTLLQKVGVGKISVADGGIQFMERSFERSGLKDFARQSGVDLVDMNRSPQLSVTSEQFPLLKSLKVFEPAYKSSLLINMPTLKIHHAASISCALKNNVGCIFRDDRIRLHRLSENEFDPTKTANFKKGVAEIARACSPDLSIIDAREILIGYEHISLGGEVRKAGVLIVSGDPVAADAYAAQVMAKNNPDFAIESTQPTLKRAEELGMGIANLDNVELIKLAA